jgi:hypothetical protein
VGSNPTPSARALVRDHSLPFTIIREKANF